MKEIFKVGDVVYVGELQGKIVDIDESLYSISVTFIDESSEFFTRKGYALISALMPALSFTPYEVIKTDVGFNVVGFTQERPHEFKKGDLVLVKNKKDSEECWVIKFFIEKRLKERFMVTSCSDFTNVSYKSLHDECKPYPTRE